MHCEIMDRKDSFAPRPPMGWNSYDYYDTAVTEQDVRDNARYMAEVLKPFGWEYVVVDIQWYASRPDAMRDRYQYIPFGRLNMDGWSRLIPDPERFPSSAGGAGFRPLADFVHSLGLKFGIHIMRGIPRAAAHGDCPVLGADATAAQAADPASICRWNPDMYGVADSPAGQAYYDSVAALYASWGVDFIKCDDICNTDNWAGPSPHAYERKHEIEMLHRAIMKTGRPMVLSLSPGPALIDKAWHYGKYANMWRITDDMWDRWDHVLAMFRRCELWCGQMRAGRYPDCDMLPLGRIGYGFRDERSSRLTKEEQRTVMTLWCIFGSPLMLGAQLTSLDEWTLSLVTNGEVLALLDPENDREQVCRDGESALWRLATPKGERYATLFNLAGADRQMSAGLEELGADGARQAVELWTGERTDVSGGTLRTEVKSHGCKLFRLCP